MRKAPDRQGTERVEPCPPEKATPIQSGLRHFGMIWKIKEIVLSDSRLDNKYYDVKGKNKVEQRQEEHW
jgi:hypothetical protein